MNVLVRNSSNLFELDVPQGYVQEPVAKLHLFYTTILNDDASGLHTLAA
jgi:hypothetical protein